MHAICTAHKVTYYTDTRTHTHTVVCVCVCVRVCMCMCMHTWPVKLIRHNWCVFACCCPLLERDAEQKNGHTAVGERPVHSRVHVMAVVRIGSNASFFVSSLTEIGSLAPINIFLYCLSTGLGEMCLSSSNTARFWQSLKRLDDKYHYLKQSGLIFFFSFRIISIIVDSSVSFMLNIKYGYRCSLLSVLWVHFVRFSARSVEAYGSGQSNTFNHHRKLWGQCRQQECHNTARLRFNTNLGSWVTVSVRVLCVRKKKGYLDWH